jgi:NitT/TauT family transport system permease protein
MQTAAAQAWASGWWRPVLARPALVRGVASVLAGLLLWEVAMRLVGSTLVLAPPSAVAAAFVRLAQTGELWEHVRISLLEFALGFGIAATVAIPLALVLGVREPAKQIADPWISALYTTPTIALAPLLIRFFGIDIWSKVAMVILVAFFPIVVTTMAGVRSVDPRFLEVARSFNARPGQIFGKVLVPATLPFIVAGLRLGLARGLMGVVVGELFGARAGLGYLIVRSAELFDTAGIFVGVVSFAALGIVGVELLRQVEARLAPWRQTSI